MISDSGAEIFKLIFLNTVGEIPGSRNTNIVHWLYIFLYSDYFSCIDTQYKLIKLKNTRFTSDICNATNFDVDEINVLDNFKRIDPNKVLERRGCGQYLNREWDFSLRSR